MRKHINPFYSPSRITEFIVPNEITENYVLWNTGSYPIVSHHSGIILSNMRGIGVNKPLVFLYNDEYITHFVLHSEINLVYTENSYRMTDGRILKVIEGDIWFSLRGKEMFVHMKPEEYMEAMLKI